MEKYVYLFSEGNKDKRDILGGKGANLAEMVNMGLPVPQGFTITTKACNKFYVDNEKLDDNIVKEINANLLKLENITDKQLGSTSNPLLLSVRSGAPISMPGMMDTILNLGLNDKIAASLAKDEHNMRFIYDSYRRLIMMFADVVKGKGKDAFENELSLLKARKKVKNDIDLSAEDMYEFTLKSKEIYKNVVGEDFPEDPKKQLIEAIKAVFLSWNTPRAISYRKINGISDNLGTAVNVQEMVYGNLTDNSLTGVAFSRNPATGEDGLYGEYLEKAQGEDIVSGSRTPKAIASMERDYPELYQELRDISKLLENHYCDMQDMEFTVENGKLYMLQTRNGKRTTLASLKIIMDLVKDGKIDKKEALMRIEPDKLDELLHSSFDAKSLEGTREIASGLPASPGAVSGKIYFTVEDVTKASKTESAILVRKETSADDIEGMNSASAILTVTGGMTSHAAVVARGLGKCCISGCRNIVIDVDKKQMEINGKVYKEGSFLSLDGSTGKIYEGVLETSQVDISDDLKTFLSWAKEVKTLGIRANAETEKDALVADRFGAEGIGLSRTEHMFFSEKKMFQMRKMIVARNRQERIAALEKILRMQVDDFEKIFAVMNNKTVTIRYLDPPLHEFLPKTEKEISLLAKEFNLSKEELIEIINSLKEVNPMMGHRGCRLFITFPEILITQTKAIIMALMNSNKKGIKPRVELMIPLVCDEREYSYLRKLIQKTILNTSKGEKLNFSIGTMIETPRSVVLADKLACNSDFFSFGTNDLTQMTYGFSRDDAGKFLNDYYDKGIFKSDPFKSVDEEGVGNLLVVGINLARKVNPSIELGVCGEHGGDPKSIVFFNKIGLDYVSCSPYRVPIAILAAAQAAIKANQK